MGGRRTSQVLVGRTAELETLDAAAKAATGGAPAVVLLAGDPGLGKSRLVTETATRQAHVLRPVVGSCLELTFGAVPFSGLLGPLRDLSAVTGSTALDLPGLLSQALGGVSLASPEQVCAAAALLVTDAASESPLLLAVEDLHWADTGTLDVLTYLIVGLRSQRVLLVGTYRPEFAPAGPLARFLNRVRRDSRVTDLLLTPLHRSDTRSQIEGVLGYEPPPELVSRVYERSEGNPYFTELLASTATASDSLPRELHDLLMEPVAALPPAPRRLLEVVCVAGGKVPAAAVVQALHALGVEAEENLGPADMLVGLRLLRLEDGYFAPFHALLGEAVASAVPPEQRRSVHSALAAALEALAVAGMRDLAGQIAVHAVRGGDSVRGLVWSLRAATEAERLHAYAAAQSHFERAAEIWDEVGEEKLQDFDLIEVLHRCAACAEGAGEWGAAAGHARRAVKLATGDPSRAALLEADMSWYAARLGTPGTSTALAESAAARLTDDAPPAVRAKVALRLVDAYYFDGNWPALQAQIDEAMQAGEESEDPAVKSRLMAAHAMVLMMNRDPAAEAVASAALAKARSSGDLTDLHMAACGLGTVLDALGRSEEAAEAYLSVVTELQEAGLARGPVAFQLAMAARSLFFLGRWDDTEKLIHRSLALQPSGVAGAHSQVVAMEAAAARGGFEQADCLWKAVQPELAMAPRIYTFMGLEGAAAAAADRGHAFEALHLSLEALELINCTLVSEFGPGRVLWTIARASADVAQSGRASGEDGSSAKEAVARAQQVIRSLGRHPFDPSDVPEGWRPEGYGASWDAELARLSRDQDAEVTAWTAAVIAWDRSQAPQFAAYARLRLVDALARVNTSRAQLVDLLRDAHATADRLDALPLRSWAQTAAKRLRVVVSAPADASAGLGTATAVLTKRERQVLDLMAAGRSNREIATGLFISEKTVSTHISNVLRKLQVTNRHDASSLILHQPPDTRTVN